MYQRGQVPNCPKKRPGTERIHLFITPLNRAALFTRVEFAGDKQHSGVEIDFANSDRSRVRYAAGATAEFFQGAALLVDVIGSSNLQSQQLSVDVPQFINKSGTSEFPNGAKRFSQDVSTDIVDVVPGVKFALGENVIGFVEFFVPINDDGLRTHFTPAGGIQATF